MNEEIDIILTRYFCGEITEKENQILDDWLTQSDENEKEFHQWGLLYQKIGQNKENPVFDMEKAFSKFSNHIYNKEKMKSRFRISYTLKIAAAIAVLLISVFAIYYFFNQPSNIVRITALESQVTKEVFDNTNVTLFANSEIIFSSKKENNITLVGKALFCVDSKTSVAGIIVQAGETFIKDIGTIFTVDATQPDKSVTVEVTEGEVWFYTKTNEGVFIKPNESAVYDVNTKQFSMIVGRQNFASPTDIRKQELVFHNTPLLDAIAVLKNNYGVDIIIKTNGIKELFLNASFDADESVENVLEIIAATFGAQLSKKGVVYVIVF